MVKYFIQVGSGYGFFISNGWILFVFNQIKDLAAKEHLNLT